MKFRVFMKQTVDEEVEVEAASPEEAVGVAFLQKAVKEVVVTLQPTAVGESGYVCGVGEYEHDVVGQCSFCNLWLTDRDVPGQPWNYGFDEEGRTYCYSCREKSKDGGKI